MANKQTNPQWSNRLLLQAFLSIFALAAFLACARQINKRDDMP
jgi:hypothetical protein